MNERKAHIVRNTAETSIDLALTIDGIGKSQVKSPVGFLNHMLEQFAKHGLFDLELAATGDTFIDDHHTVEDVGICLGLALVQALGDKSGIARHGYFILPMDEAISTVAVDVSGRYSFRFDAVFEHEKVGDMSTDMMRHFWDSFAQNAKLNLYVKSEFGLNDHHRAEGIFKAVAKAIRMAATLDPRLNGQLPSTKGVL